MTYADVMTQHGFVKDHAPTIDTHETWTNQADHDNQILIDVHGGEWHHMRHGDVNKVGSLDQKGLRVLAAFLTVPLESLPAFSSSLMTAPSMSGSIAEATSRIFANLNEMPMETGSGLALHSIGEADWILFRPHPTLRKLLLQGDFEETEEYIFGVLELRDNEKYDVWEVDSVWAKKGYGPLLYYVALSFAGKRGLTANRGKVTEAAKSIWRKFASEFKDKVNILSLGQPYSQHAEDVLNRKFVLKHRQNYSALSARARTFLANDRYGEVKTALEEAGDAILRSRMNDAYPQG